MRELTICKPNIGVEKEFIEQFAEIKQYKLSVNQTESLNKKIKVLSLFSGCGGLDLGFVGDFEFKGRKFEKNNFKIVFSNDFDKAATKVYNAVWG